MKIALIRRQFSPVGGAELYLQRLATALVEAGHEVHLFAQAWSPLPTGAILHTLECPGGRSRRPIAFAHAVEAALHGATFDCVFSLERTRCQDVYRAGDGVHRVWLERRWQFAPWWRRWFIGLGGFHRAVLQLEAVTLNPFNTSLIIANSEMVRREIEAHYRFPSERIVVVRNGVTVERLRRGNRAATRARFGVTGDEFLLLFVGSGWERKGLRFLLEAFARLRTAHDASAGQKAAVTADGGSGRSGRLRLLVVGKGKPPRRPVAGVTFAGPMAEVEDAYAAADLLVFLPIYEPSANVVFEALAAGLPVVTTAQNGAAEVIEEGITGSVVRSPADLDAVSRAIRFWQNRRVRLSDLDLRPLSLDRNVAETLAVLERAIRERRP